MGCLFPCFRPHSPSGEGDSVSQPKSKRGHDSKNRLSDLFLSEEKAPSSPCIHVDKDEAQLLKACSRIPTIPIEIKKASENLETPPQRFTSSRFDYSSSCITDCAKISTGYSEESQGSIGTAFCDGVDRTSKVPPLTDGKRKSVRFECDLDQSSYSSCSSKNITLKIPEEAGEITLSATSHSLTSLKLADEIQTHGTIFPANTEPKIKERPSVRSQLVHSLSNQTEIASLSNLPEDSDESLYESKVQTCKMQIETESPLSVTTCEGKLEDSSAIISLCVKQSEENSNNDMAALSTITSRDRPIIGMVAAHWNKKDQSQISPKWWDGNGIPNSTNKYKEDQKVSWHTTPFEERLEKALSEEGGQGSTPSRKLEIMEEGERDTAISQLHHSSQSTSIVSF